MNFFSRFKRGLRKAAIFLLILGGIAVIVITFTTFGGKKLFGKKSTVIYIDAGTGQEIDDLFAIARALSSERLELKGLSSIHWDSHPLAGDSSMDISLRTNIRMLELFGKSGIPNPAGARSKLWFENEPKPVPSPASEFILQEAAKLTDNNKLNILCFGALTNVASAIMLDSSVASKIRLYVNGLKYDPRTKVWNKNEYNTRNDLDATDFCLNTKDLEMHIMPQNTAENLVFRKNEYSDLLSSAPEKWRFLIRQWDELYPGKEQFNMPAVALLEAVIDPELARVEQVLTPPENVQRPVRVYTYINKDLMEASWQSAVMKSIREEE